MSFQLGGPVGAVPPLQRPVARLPSAVSVGRSVPLPVNAQPVRPAEAGLRTTSPEEYDEAASKYMLAELAYPVADCASAATRASLNQQAASARREFEALGVRLEALQQSYKEIGEFDNSTHDTRELAYDALIGKYKDLAPEVRNGKLKPGYPVRSEINRGDTSSKFRDDVGKLTGAITEQCHTRAPDWLDTLTDTVGAVLEGWRATSEAELSAKSATNDLRRSRTALALATHNHMQIYSKATWTPAVVLAAGESLAQNVSCSFSWDDMYGETAEGAQSNTPLIETFVNLSAPPLSSDGVVAARPVRECGDGPAVVPCEAVDTSGLESLSIEALTEIGNKVEDGLRAATIKKLSAVPIAGGAAMTPAWFRQ
jgi:hypothetical protein